MSPPIVLLLTFVTLISFTIADGLLSIGSFNDFKSLRSCALGCFNGGIRDGYRVADELDCRKPGVVYVAPDNDCFCRPDLQETAVRYLSDCASTSCSGNELDMSSATEVYKDYCSSAGYTAATPKSVAAQTTAGTVGILGPTGASTSSSEAPTETTDSGLEPTSSSRPSPGGGSSLSVGGIVGIVAGVVGALAAVIGCFLRYKQYQKQKLQGKQVPHS